MKLAAKIVGVLVGLMVLLLVLDALVTARHQRDVLREDSVADASHFGRAVVRLLESGSTSAEDLERLRQLLNPDSQTHLSARFVVLDVTARDPQAPRVSPEHLQFHDNEARADWVDDHGRDICLTYVRLRLDDGRDMALELSSPDQFTAHGFRYFLWKGLVLALLAVLGSAVIVMSLGAVWVGQPLQRLTEKARRIGIGDLSGPLRMRRRDELGELARAIDGMCEQLSLARSQVQQEADARREATEQLRHADRLRMVGRLAAGIAHEVGTPLNVISGRASMISSGRLDSDQVRHSADTIKSEADRITRIVRQLLDFARRSPPQRKSVDMVGVVRQTLDLMQTIAEERRSALAFVPPDEPMKVSADPGQIQQVLTNLVVNAVEAMPSGGRVTLELDQVPAADVQQAMAAKRDAELGGEHGGEQAAEHGTEDGGEPEWFVRLAVRDEGSGIDSEHLEQLFEPFFTTKGVGEGTGLGLSIAYGIVRDHRGWIEVQSQPGAGSCFSVYLPREDSTA